MARVHQVRKSDWPKLTWVFPRIHNFEFGFGLSADDSTKASTIVPWMFQDNALVDYETIKTNPENVDYATIANANCAAGSYIPKIQVTYVMNIPPSDTEIIHLQVDTLPIAISMLNRLDAFDKKTGNDIETILELTHETTDEQTYPLFNNTKLFESGGTYDYDAAQPGLTGTQQPEGVAFDKEMFFDAMHYYTNKEMLKSVTANLRNHTLSEPIIPHGRSIIVRSGLMNVPSLCKFMNPYSFCGQLFSVPQTGSRTQFHLAGETSGVEHLMVRGFVRFFEYNPDFNFSRA